MAVVVTPISMLIKNMDLTPTVAATYGTLRNGRADLAHGYRINWESRLSLLFIPHLSTEFVLVGADTRVTGVIQASVFGATLHDVQGRAGPGLAQLAPGAWQCDMPARLVGVGFDWGWRFTGASGVISTPAGACSKGDNATEIPPLTLTLTSEDKNGVLSLTNAKTELLARIRISRSRTLDIAIKPAAADVFPQLPRGGSINLQVPF